MIWIWIAAALLISMLLLKGKHISFVNYLWVLLPIDMYGVTIASVTIKPYMAFCAVLLIMFLYGRKRSFFIGNTAILFVLLGTLAVNMFNGGTQESLRSVSMVIVVYLCAAVYASSVDENIREIPDAIVAASIGYGIVFLTAYLLFNFGINLPGIAAIGRTETGMIMQFDNMSGGEFIRSFRLRGFNIDPNASVGLFLSAFAIDVATLFSGERKKGRVYRVSFALSLVCIFLTSSRMGIAVALFTIVVSGVSTLRMISEDQRRKILNRIAGLSLLLLPALAYIVIKTNILGNLLQGFSNRSGFNDQYGRGSIWREAISTWIQRGFLFGVGTGNIKYFISTQIESHNSWLEWLCGCGILAGGAVIITFISILSHGIRVKRAGLYDDKILFQALLTGLIGMVLSLISVDNITNGYLWFFTLTLLKYISLNETRRIRLKHKYLKG